MSPTINQNLTQIVDCPSEIIFEPEREMSCIVGDATFQELLDMIAKKRDNRNEEQVLRWKLELLKAKTDPSFLTKRDNSHITRLLAASKVVENIDYSERVMKQLAEFNKNGNGKKSFKGLPMTIFDSHFHSYFAIKNYLQQAEEPVVIVRFDAHHDSFYETSKIIAGNNYVFHLMHDREVSCKIKEVITAGACFPFTGHIEGFKRDKEREATINSERFKSYKINGINHSLCFIEGLPEVSEPAILDIDLDCHEEAQEDAHMYGYFMLRKTETYAAGWDNQKCIFLHPKVAAGTLQEKVKDPRIILLATERGFRNGYFHHRIEHDFLEQLMS